MIDKPQITETAMDFLKFGTVAAAPGAQLIFGATLQEWMYIASIVASIFYILDKVPGVVRRIHGWIKRKSSSRNGSNGLTDGESTL